MKSLTLKKDALIAGVKEKIKNTNYKKLARTGLVYFVTGLILSGCFVNGVCDVAQADTELSDIMNNMVDIVLMIFKYVGFMLAVYGIAQLVSAFRNDDADSKQRAINLLVVGVALVFLDNIVDMSGIKDSLTK